MIYFFGWKLETLIPTFAQLEYSNIVSMNLKLWQQSCNYCAATTASVASLEPCALCLSVFYCSNECQASDSGHHKKPCDILTNHSAYQVEMRLAFQSWFADKSRELQCLSLAMLNGNFNNVAMLNIVYDPETDAKFRIGTEDMDLTCIPFHLLSIAYPDAR